MINWFKKEFLRMLPIFIFFLIIFSLADLTRLVMAKNRESASSSFAVILMGALIMGKVVLLSERLPFINLFGTKPLIYNTIWKTMIYLLCSLVIRLVERMVSFCVESANPAELYAKMSQDVEKMPFWLSQAWLFVLLLIFVAYQELVYAVGIDKVRKMFFGGYSPPPPP